MRDRRAFRAIPDPAFLLDQANQFATAGRTGRALARLNSAIRLSPRFWQAYQYRGELLFLRQDYEAALRDFDKAVSLAPDESHLYALRAQAHLALGDTVASSRDFERASSSE
jgi:tetratricopeptide (TPR) repeat protein